MNSRRFTMVVAIFGVIFLSVVPFALADELIVVGTEKTIQESQPWVDFLKSNEVPMRVVSPEYYGNYKQAGFIIIMGGLDEPGGIKDIAEEVLGKEELESVTRGNTGRMFLKPDLWTSGQYVVLFVGPDGKAAIEARKANKEKWWDIITEYFEIEGGGGFHTY
ncbi:MAG: hypothetical protein JRJ03_20230 [Deltaproteobacteria bacterium]|nr:hypothetical protein [Deltaproteobacteria bacterium]MBW2067239.1 hypothetical protein [Deltaproteobacteria bacterium]